MGLQSNVHLLELLDIYFCLQHLKKQVQLSQTYE